VKMVGSAAINRKTVCISGPKVGASVFPVVNRLIEAVDRSETNGDNGGMNHETLARDIRRDKAERARQMSLDERLTAGAKLYAEQMRLARSLVAGLHPDWTDAQVDAEMFRREELIRQRNTKKYYRTVSSAENRPVERS